MSELSPEALGLIRSAEGGDDPSDADRERIRLSLEQKLGAAAFAATVVAAGTTKSLAAGASLSSLAGTEVSAAAGAVKAGALGLVSKLLIGAGMVTAVSAAVVIASPRDTASTKQAVPVQKVLAPAERPMEQAPEANAIEDAPVVTPQAEDVREEAGESGASPSNKTARGRRVAAPARTASSLSEELSLLNRAQQALVGGDAQEALIQARAHIAKFPSGTLHEEARAVEALSRCALGEPQDDVIATFEKHAPRSVLISRVRAGCKGK